MPAPNPQISDVHRFPALFSEIWLCPIDDTDTIADAQWPTPASVAAAVKLSVDSAGRLVLAGPVDVNGANLVLDADADTYLDASTDDVVNVYINGALDFTFTANTFTALSGSSIATNTISETTAATGVTIDGLRLMDASIKPVAGGSLYLDLSACATGEADILTAANLASAHESRDSVGTHWRTCTTTGARRHELVIPLELQAGYRLNTYAAPYVEEFYGDVGQTLPTGLAKDLHGDATGDYISGQGPGVYRLSTAVTSEAEGAQLTAGDSLHILLSKAPIVEARVRFAPAGATLTADERWVFGLVSAHANAEDALDSTTYNLWFRVEGASNAVVVEKDDGTTDTDDQASGLTVVKNSWHVFRIDCSTISAPALTMDGTAQSGGALSMTAASAQFVQPILCIQRDAGTEINTLDIDYLAIYQTR